MSLTKDYKELYVNEHPINFRIIRIITVIIVLTLTSTYLTNIYSLKKQQIIQKLEYEASITEHIISNYLAYSKYYLLLLSDILSNNLNDPKFIREKLNFYHQNQKLDNGFACRELFWIDKNFFKTISTNKIITNPNKSAHIENIVKGKHFNNQNITFFTKKNKLNENSLYVINNIFEAKTSNYLGSLAINYSQKEIIENIVKFEGRKEINFAILDKNYQIVAKSGGLDNIIYKSNLCTEIQ